MAKPNVHGLPQHLRKDEAGYFLDYFVQEKGLKKRKRVRLGQIPLTQAKRILAQNMGDMAEQKYLAPDKPKVGFFQAVDSYLAYSKARKKSYLRDTYRMKWFKEFFGDRPLDSFSSDLVEAYLVRRREKGHRNRPDKVVSDATLNLDIAILKALMHRAVLNRMIEWDPIQGVKKFKPFFRNRTLDPEEYQKLLENCSGHLKPIVGLAYLTAMRCGEILKLRWDQVDFKNGVIVLEAEDTKTQERREIPLMEEMQELLKQIPQTLPCCDIGKHQKGELGKPFSDLTDKEKRLDNSYVFTWRGHSMESVKTAFRRACRNAGIENFKFHDLRHCAITNLRKAGVSDSVIMSISGHKTHAVFRKYDRVDREDRRAALRKATDFNDRNMTGAAKKKNEQVTA